jgi:hypothetical protein
MLLGSGTAPEERPEALESLKLDGADRLLKSVDDVSNGNVDESDARDAVAASAAAFDPSTSELTPATALAAESVSVSTNARLMSTCLPSL